MRKNPNRTRAVNKIGIKQSIYMFENDEYVFSDDNYLFLKKTTIVNVS